MVNDLYFPTLYTHQGVFLNFEAIWQCLAVIYSKPSRHNNSGIRDIVLLNLQAGLNCFNSEQR